MLWAVHIVPAKRLPWACCPVAEAGAGHAAGGHVSCPPSSGAPSTAAAAPPSPRCASPSSGATRTTRACTCRAAAASSRAARSCRATCRRRWRSTWMRVPRVRQRCSTSRRGRRAMPPTMGSVPGQQRDQSVLLLDSMQSRLYATPCPPTPAAPAPLPCRRHQPGGAVWGRHLREPGARGRGQPRPGRGTCKQGRCAQGQTCGAASGGQQSGGAMHTLQPRWANSSCLVPRPAGVLCTPASPVPCPWFLQELAAKMAHPVISFQEGPSNGGSGSGEQHAEVVRSCRWGAPSFGPCSCSVNLQARVAHDGPPHMRPVAAAPCHLHGSRWCWAAGSCAVCNC